MEFIDLKAQSKLYKSRFQDAIDRVLVSGAFINGPEVYKLERTLAEFVGARFCISCANGTDALQIAYMAVGVGPGDEVITPAFTYIATAEAAAIIGATPVYVDIDPDTFLIDVSKLEAAITDKTRAIAPVSLFGQCPNMEEIRAIANRYEIPVIEDAAQSFGACYRGARSCGLTEVATTSFFPTKPLGCFGDGGAIFTSDEALARSMRMIACHGQAKKYTHDVVGMNSRLDTIQAAVLLEKMKIFERELELRRDVASRYSERLKSFNSLSLPIVLPDRDSAWAQYTIRVDKRDAVREGLRKRGIPSMVYYPVPLHKQRAVSRNVSMPSSEKASDTVLSLPFSPYISEEQQDRVVFELGAVLTDLGVG